MHITRNLKEKCIMARVMRQKERHQENFTVRRFGSWEKAEKAARRWVKQKIIELPPEIPREGRMTSRNRSGVVGVHRSHSVKQKPNGKEYDYWFWKAHWPECSYKGGLSWSLIQFGDDGAFVLAFLARQHKSIDRDYLLSEFDRIYLKKEYRDILTNKKI